VRVVDLGDDPRMLAPELRLDGFNFSTGGHAVAAENVAPAVLELINHAGRRTP
jgi:lysophospholipase L1-like esterase